jgi:hypothetical protein
MIGETCHVSNDPGLEHAVKICYPPSIHSNIGKAVGLESHPKYLKLEVREFIWEPIHWTNILYYNPIITNQFREEMRDEQRT